MIRPWSLALLLVLCFLAPTLRAEGDEVDFEGVPVEEAETQPQNGNAFIGETANGLSAGVLNNTLVDPSGVQFDNKNNENGREYKANSASGSGIAGGAIATATGAALMAAGMGMLAILETENQLAGADLVAKGAQQLAQGITDLATSGQNQGQDDLLRDAVGQQGAQLGFDDSRQNSQEVAKRQVKEEVITPELEKQLAAKGISADDFIDQALSGALNSREAVLNLFGGPTDFTDEDLAKADALASGTTGELLEARTQQLQAAGIVDEDGLPTLSVGFAEDRPAGSNVGGSAKFSSETPGGKGEVALTQAPKGRAISEKIAPIDVQGIVGQYMKKFQHRKKLAQSKKTMGRALQLQSLGIRALDRAKNIFYISKRCYRQFESFRNREMVRIKVKNGAKSRRLAAAKNSLKKP